MARQPSPCALTATSLSAADHYLSMVSVAFIRDQPGVKHCMISATDLKHVWRCHRSHIARWIYTDESGDTFRLAPLIVFSIATNSRVGRHY